MKIDINHPQTTFRYLAENLVLPEVTFNDIKGQHHIAYDAWEFLLPYIYT